MKDNRSVLFSRVGFFLLYFSIFFPAFGEDTNLSIEKLTSFFEQGKHLHDEGERNLRELENVCMKQWPDVTKRAGKSLKISIGKYSDSFNDVGQYGMENSKNHYFIHFFPQFEVALVYCGENTWDTFLLINPSGNIEMPGLPIFSKDGERAFSFRSDEMNGDEFQIVKFEKNQIIEEILLGGKDFLGFGGFSTPIWLSNKSIEIRSKGGQWESEKENPKWIVKKILLNFDPKAKKWKKSDLSEIEKEDPKN